MTDPSFGNAGMRQQVTKTHATGAARSYGLAAYEILRRQALLQRLAYQQGGQNVLGQLGQNLLGHSPQAGSGGGCNPVLPISSGFNAACNSPYAAQQGIAYPPAAQQEVKRVQVKREGIRIGEIRAYRAWGLVEGLLISVSSPEIWAPGEAMTARDCDLKKGLGIFSFKLKRDAYKAFPRHVVGAIDIWGEICEHDIGYRSEFAKIVGVDRGTCPRGAYADLCERYDLAA